MRIVCMAGLPGTGKSALGAEIARRLGGPVLSKDAVRLALFGSEWTDYTREQDGVCWSAVLEAARSLARSGGAPAVVLDGRTFTRRESVVEVRELAEELGCELELIECVCPTEVAVGRLEADRGRHPAANRTPELYRRLAAAAEPIPPPKRVVDTSTAPAAELAERALRVGRR